MKKNKNMLISILLVLIAAFLIIFSFILSSSDKSSTNNNDPNNNKPSNENVDSDNTVVYLCKSLLKEEGNVGFTSYVIERIYVLDGRVLKAESTMEITCDNEEIYLSFKEDKKYSVGKEFIDGERKIRFNNGETKDYTKDINGKDMTLEFDDYETQLNNVGYTCKEE